VLAARFSHNDQLTHFNGLVGHQTQMVHPSVLEFPLGIFIDIVMRSLKFTKIKGIVS
jgi:hypothetical protein